MTWDVTDLGFRMGLSPQVPEVLSRHVGRLVDDLLAAHGLRSGRRRRLGGAPGRAADPRRRAATGSACRRGALAASRDVLREHGNCSSPTVLLVLDALRAAAAGRRASTWSRSRSGPA